MKSKFTSTHGLCKTKAFVFTGLFFLVLNIAVSQAQFLDLRLDVDSKVSAKTEKSLNFGRLMTDTGRSEIEIGNNNMGVFSIRALENQILLISMELPDQLYHASPDVSDTVLVELRSRYGYSLQDYESSYPLSTPHASLTVDESSTFGPWSFVYFFIFGSVTVGDIAGGMYSNDITLHVEYL